MAAIYTGCNSASGLDPSVRAKMPKIQAKGSSRPVAAGHDWLLTGCPVRRPPQAIRGVLQRAHCGCTPGLEAVIQRQGNLLAKRATAERSQQRRCLPVRLIDGTHSVRPLVMHLHFSQREPGVSGCHNGNKYEWHGAGIQCAMYLPSLCNCDVSRR